MIEHNYHSRWGELDLIAVKSDEDDFVGEMYFDEEMQEMKGDATLLQGNSVRFVEECKVKFCKCSNTHEIML